MRDLVGDDVGDALQFGLGSRRRIDQQCRLAEGHGSQVLHRPGGEVGDRHQVELVTRIGDAVVAGEESQGEGTELLGEPGEVRLSRHVDDTKRGAVDVDRRRRLQRADDEREQVRRQLHRGPEADPPATVGQRLVCLHGSTGDRHEVPRHDQGYRKRRLEIRFVPAGEGPAGVGRLELGGGQGVLGAGVVREDRPVEAPQLIVQDPAEVGVQPPRSGLDRLGRPEDDALGRLIELGSQGDALSGLPVHQLGSTDLELGAVDDDGVRRLEDVHVDGNAPGERRRDQIGLECEGVVSRNDASW